MKSLLIKKYFLVCLVLIISGLGLLFFTLGKGSDQSLPKDIRNQITSFQPYYFPKGYTLPEDFKIDKESIKYEQDTLLFSLISSSGKIATLSQQSLPEEFSKDDGSLIGKETFDSPNGKITVSFVEGRTTAFLISKDKDAFIIINSNQAISSDDLRVILSSLVKT